MPSLPTYALQVGLHYQKPARFNEPVATAPFVPLQDGDPSVRWSHGMNHPIFLTVVESPVVASTKAPIPFKIAVSFNQEDVPEYMKGDVRVELRIDGVVCGLKIFSEAKFKGKGIHHEFTGLRVGRTEQRPFIFNTLPKGTRTDVNNAKSPSLRELGETLCEMSIPFGDDIVPEASPDDSLIPFFPAELPPRSSHIQVLVSLGKKYRTLEKYLVDSAVQQSAFYIKPDVANSLNYRDNPDNTKGKTNRKLSSISAPQAGLSLPGCNSRHSLFLSNEGEAQLNHESPPRVDHGKRSLPGWMPVGFSNFTQKTVQTKEVEFVARMHLLRVWVIVVPPPKLVFPEPGIITSPNDSKIITLRLPKERLTNIILNCSEQTLASGTKALTYKAGPAPRGKAANSTNSAGGVENKSALKLSSISPNQRSTERTVTQSQGVPIVTPRFNTRDQTRSSALKHKPYHDSKILERGDIRKGHSAAKGNDGLGSAKGREGMRSDGIFGTSTPALLKRSLRLVSARPPKRDYENEAPTSLPSQRKRGISTVVGGDVTPKFKRCRSATLF